MIDWSYLLAAASFGFMLGMYVKEREQAKEKEADFERRMEAMREQARKVDRQ